MAHSLIEDTLVVLALGAHTSGVLWARLLFSILVVALMVRILRSVSDETFKRYFMRSTQPDPA